jgi:tetratricopeptide (TPR) repeat protein
LGWPAQSPGNWIWPSLAFLIVLEIASVLLNLLPIPPLDGYGIIEPWLSQKAQIQFNKIGEYGVWVIFGLLWFVQPLNQFFWDSTYSITETLGVPPEMAGMGYALFRKQSNILILGLVGVLWLFRRKEIKWYNQGNKLRKLQRYEDAIASYERAIEIKSDYYEAWYYRSYLLYQLQRYEEAITSYDKVIQLNPEEANAWYYRGLILEKLQQPKEALASYDKVIQLNPEEADAWYNRGIALEKLQRYEEAIASFDKAIQIQSDFPYAWYNKACCYALQGNVPLAIETLQQAINLDPDKFREQAKTDSSFDTIQENQLFKNLIGE